MIPGFSYAQGPVKLFSWQIVQTEFTVLRFKSEDILTTFNQKIEYGPSVPSEAAIETHVAQKVDAVFSRASQILDMKKRFAPVRINLYKDSAALKRAYESIYPGQCHIRAWYRFKNNTIYVNVQDLTAGILAHEMAHAIIDHYLTVRPPRQSAEILARYVDSHIGRGFVE